MPEARIADPVAGWQKQLGLGGLRTTLAAEGQGLPYLGFRIFKWLVLLVLLIMVPLVLWGWRSYPQWNDYVAVGDIATEAQAQAYETARAAWVTGLKDLGQTYLVTPVFPLIAAVLGYIFGRDRGSAVQPGGGEPVVPQSSGGGTPEGQPDIEVAEPAQVGLPGQDPPRPRSPRTWLGLRGRQR